MKPKKLSLRGMKQFLSICKILETALPSERDRILKAVRALYVEDKNG